MTLAELRIVVDTTQIDTAMAKLKSFNAQANSTQKIVSEAAKRVKVDKTIGGGASSEARQQAQAIREATQAQQLWNKAMSESAILEGRAFRKLQTEAGRAAGMLMTVEGATYRNNVEMQRYNYLRQRGAMSEEQFAIAVANSNARLQLATQRIQAYNAMQRRMGQDAQFAQHHMINLFYQIQDVIVGLASGQRVGTVFIQQGLQMQGIASSAGIGMIGLAKAIGMLILPFTPLIAALGLAFGAFKRFQSVVNEQTDLEAYARSLGLTEEEFDKLETKVKDFDITFGDVFKGLIMTMEEFFGTSTMWNKWADGAVSAFDWILKQSKNVMAALYGITVASVNTFIKTWHTFPAAIAESIVAAANFSLRTIEAMVNESIDVINTINPFEQIGKVSIPEIPNPWEGTTGNIVNMFMDEAVTAMDEAVKAMDRFGASWEKNTGKAAEERVKKLAEEIRKVSKEEEKRANIISKANLALDNQILRAQMLTEEREKQAQIDRVNEQLAGRGFALLTDTETASLRRKIDVLAEMEKIQKVIDEQYSNSSKKAAENYKIAQAGLLTALQKGYITQKEYNRELFNAKMAYEDATDPLIKYRRELEETERVIGKFGIDRIVAGELSPSATAGMSNTDRTEAERLIRTKERTLEVDKALGNIWQENIGTVRNLAIQQEALNKALAEGYITGSQYAVAIKDLNLQALQLSALQGNMNPFEAWGSGLALYASDFKGVMAELQTIGANFTTNFANGMSDAFARSIVSGDSFKDSMYDLSVNVLQQVLSSITQMGIKYAIATALGQKMTAMQLLGIQQVEAAKTAATVKTVGENTAIASSAAPAAAAQAGATYVASAIAGALALGALLAMIPQFMGFKEGGYTGNGGTNDIAGFVHGREWVTKASDLRRGDNRSVVEAIHNGATFNSNSMGNTKANTEIKVNIQNFGSGKSYEVQQLSPDEIRIIARDEVRTQTPKIVSQQISRPNSEIATSLARHTKTEWNRNG